MSNETSPSKSSFTLLSAVNSQPFIPKQQVILKAPEASKQRSPSTNIDAKPFVPANVNGFSPSGELFSQISVQAIHDLPKLRLTTLAWIARSTACETLHYQRQVFLCRFLVKDVWNWLDIRLLTFWGFQEVCTYTVYMIICIAGGKKISANAAPYVPTQPSPPRPNHAQGGYQRYPPNKSPEGGHIVQITIIITHCLFVPLKEKVQQTLPGSITQSIANDPQRGWSTKYEKYVETQSPQETWCLSYEKLLACGIQCVCRHTHHLEQFKVNFSLQICLPHWLHLLTFVEDEVSALREVLEG